MAVLARSLFHITESPCWFEKCSFQTLAGALAGFSLFSGNSCGDTVPFLLVSCWILWSKLATLREYLIFLLRDLSKPGL